MAKIQMGPCVTGIRGKIGGVSFQKNGYGISYRVNGVEVLTASINRQAARAAHKLASVTWSNVMTQAEQAAWRSHAVAHPAHDAWGNPIALSGFAQSIRYNINLVTVGFAPQTSPPASLAVSAVGSLAATATVAGAVLTADSVAIPPAAGEFLILKMSKPLSRGSAGLATHTTRAIVVPNPVTFPVDLMPYFLSRYGAAYAGQTLKLAATIINSANGAQGPEASTFVTFV